MKTMTNNRCFTKAYLEVQRLEDTPPGRQVFVPFSLSQTLSAGRLIRWAASF